MVRIVVIQVLLRLICARLAGHMFRILVYVSAVRPLITVMISAITIRHIPPAVQQRVWMIVMSKSGHLHTMELGVLRVCRVELDCSK